MPASRSQLLFDQWCIMRDWVNMYLKELTDEELSESILPGKNHGVWILGHLIASDDTLTDHLGYGPILFPGSQKFAQSNGLLPIAEYPSVPELRHQWDEVCKKNEEALRKITDSELDEFHAMIRGIPEEDFFRTKERVIIYWTLHQLHHAGQLAILLSKFGRRLI